MSGAPVNVHYAKLQKSLIVNNFSGITLSVTSPQTNKLSNVNNQRVYQELVYRNKVFKTILTGCPDLSFFPTRTPTRRPPAFFNPTLTESLEQAMSHLEKWVTIAKWIIFRNMCHT